MSNFLAVATVTATLANLLQPIAGVDVPGAQVTTLRPDGQGSGMPKLGVNIFLYQVAPNPFWRNADLPTRDSANGNLVQRPRAALDLHYLLTFYGEEASLEPQRLLGSVVRTIHAYPVLSRAQIQQTITNPTYNYLATSDLADEVELVKFSPLALSLEELSKLWSVFFEIDYALSIAYQASVVFVEPEESFSAALPVRIPVVTVVPFSYPTISSVVPQMLEYQSGATITVMGSSLQAGDPSVVTQVTLGDEVMIPDPPPQADRVVVHLPAGASAGISALQVRQQINVGDQPNPELRPGFESNVATLIIQPVLQSITLSQVNNPNPGQSPVQHFDVEVAPAIGPRQRAELLLNQYASPPVPAPLTFTLPAQPRVADGSALVFETTGVPTGTYVVRVRIDGADSQLRYDPTPGSATYNMPYQPTVNVA